MLNGHLIYIQGVCPDIEINLCALGTIAFTSGHLTYPTLLKKVQETL